MNPPVVHLTPFQTLNGVLGEVVTLRDGTVWFSPYAPGEQAVRLLPRQKGNQ